MTTIVEWLNNIMTGHFGLKTELADTIDGIAALLAEDDPKSIISVLLEQQENMLKEELEDCQKKLDLVDGIRKEVNALCEFSVESIGDIANVMNKKDKLKKMRWGMILSGIPVTVFQWVAIVLGITDGLWWLLAAWACVAIPWGIAVSVYYFKHVAYICPSCHNVFKPKLGKTFWAYHTPKMRRLTCEKCGRRGLCVEIYRDKEKENNG